MKKEDLLKILADAGLQQEEILALCQEIVADLSQNQNQEQENPNPVDGNQPIESEDDKRKRIFGI